MNKLTIDFENNRIHIQTDNQDGVEIVPNLMEKRRQIYDVLGYSSVDLSEEIAIINDIMNGRSETERHDLHSDKVQDLLRQIDDNRE